MPAERISVVQGAVDLRFGGGRRSPPNPADRYGIHDRPSFALSSLQPRKNFVRLIEAYSPPDARGRRSTARHRRR